MKIYKRVLPVLLAGMMALSAVTPAIAAPLPSEKEEVIYVKLKADGELKNIYAVNIFGRGDITDYGDYSSVGMLNTDDEITQNGDAVTFYASADRTYYEGKMKTADIPWDISISYFIDGKQLSADEAAGKSGKLEIHFKVTENTACGGGFFDNYALQATFTLDTDKCSNVAAADATVANAGGNKQLSYTMLPGKGIDTVITADVTDFEMDAVTINGIPLSLNVEVDDAELMEQVTDLLDAIQELDDGTGELKDGVSELQDSARDELKSGTAELAQGAGSLRSGAAALKKGGGALNDGTAELRDGAASLYSGVQILNEGILLMQDGLNELNAKSAELTGGSAEIKAALLLIQQKLDDVSVSSDQITRLVQGSSEMKDGIKDLAAGTADLQSVVSFSAYKAAMSANGLDIDRLQEGNAQTIQTLNEQMETLNGQIAQLDESGQDTAQLRAQASQLQETAALLQGNSAAISGMDAYLTEINGSVGELADGAAALQENYALIDDGINELAVTMSDMIVRMSELRDGIDALAAGYDELDSGISSYTAGVAEIVAGYSQLAAGSGEVLSGSKAVKDGAEELCGKTGELLSGIVKIYNAAGELKNGAGELDDGVADLLDAIADLYTGTGELKDGTVELRSETDGMDTDVSDSIDDMLASVTGGDFETVSFVSEKNTNVDSVQFVIQTEAVKTEQAVVADTTAEGPLTFWQKLLRLFGLY